MNFDELVSKITEYNEAYKRGFRIVPDSEYDALLENLRSIAPNHPLCAEVQQDFEISGDGKIDYGDNPMLSLQKFYDLGELVKWIKKTAESPEHKIVLEPKYDGMSAQYNNGILSTRGDGKIGQVISQKLPFFMIDHWTWDNNDIGEITGYSIPTNSVHEDSVIHNELIIDRKST